MPEIPVYIEVYCAKCNAILCNQTEALGPRDRNDPRFDVKPCERCLRAAYEDGYDEGFAEGDKE